MRCSFVSSVLLIASFFFDLPAAAQHAPQNVTLTGIVLDPSRAPIAGARVTALTHNRGRRVSTQTDERGQFTILIDTRDFVLTVAANGFVTLSETITGSTAAVTREFVLQVQGVRETVSVTATQAVITGGTRMPAS